MSATRGRPVTTSAAVLLRSVAYGEADRIVTMLTDSHGKLALMARSARRSSKRFAAGSLEPFGVAQIEFSLGGGEVGRLAGARTVRAFPAILGSLAAMQAGGAALELVRRVAPERQPDPEAVPTLARFFELLDAGGGPTARIAFELRFLAIAGLAPMLCACSRCGRAPKSGQAALFDPTLGGLVCRACGGGPIHLSGALRDRMARWLDDSWHQEVSPLPPAELSEAREFVDVFVRSHVHESYGTGRTRQGKTEKR